jgi:hypothetical protein
MSAKDRGYGARHRVPWQHSDEMSEMGGMQSDDWAIRNYRKKAQNPLFRFVQKTLNKV